jgi:hypothetical protein
MQLLRQHAPRLHRIGSHHLQQDALHTDALVFKLLGISGEQVLGHRCQQIVDAS